MINNKRLGSSPLPLGLIDEYVQPSSQKWLAKILANCSHVFNLLNRLKQKNRDPLLYFPSKAPNQITHHNNDKFTVSKSPHPFQDHLYGFEIFSNTSIYSNFSLKVFQLDIKHLISTLAASG